jgi:uncharacterized membrane protein
VPVEDVMPLDMSVDDAMRLVFTLGVVSPPWPGDKPQLEIPLDKPPEPD